MSALFPGWNLVKVTGYSGGIFIVLLSLYTQIAGLYHQIGHDSHIPGIFHLIRGCIDHKTALLNN